MDPVTALGAAAAGAQFVGLAVKSVLGSAKLIQDIRDEPKRAIELLTWVENEVTSMQTLLHPESLVFSHLTTTQYIQIAPHAVKARQAMDKVNNLLSPLVRDIDSLNNRDDVGKRIMLIWKSILTVKSMKSIETDLGIIRLLNATLLRELHVCGLETQSLLRNQSTQVLSIISDLSKRHEEFRQSMKQIDASIAVMAQTVATIKDKKDGELQESLRMHMMQISYLQSIQNMLSMMAVQPRLDSEGNSGAHAESEPSAMDNAKYYLATPKRGSRFPRCKCRSNKLSTTRKFGPFVSKTDPSAFQVCPLHGRIARKAFSIEMNLTPWVKGSLQVSLGMLFQGNTWSILPPVKFQGIVKRSDSPIFRLIDDFISSCSTMENFYGPQRQRVRLLLEDSTGVRLAWDSQRTKDGLATITHGIQEAVATGLASYSDTDERGCTLLTELSLLFAFLGEELFNVETEMLQLFQLAFNSNLDPTVPFSKIHDMRKYKVYGYRSPHLKSGDILAIYAMQRGTISTSLYNAFLEYEGLAESIGSGKSFRWDCQFLQTIISDPLFAEAVGYCDFSLAIISRSLERLHKYLCADRFDQSSTRLKFSPLELALGWTEGMQVLIDHNLENVLEAFRSACVIDDVNSARLLLSAKAAIPFHPNDLDMSPGNNHFCFTEALDIAKWNLIFFRLAAEELWKRRDILIATMIDYLRLERVPELLWTTLGLITNTAVRNHLEILGPHGTEQVMANLLSSAVHVNSDFGLSHHQVLFDVGFTDVDTWCGLGVTTPLGHLCQQVQISIFPGSRETKDWCSSILWFLKAGASPRLGVESTGHDRYGGTYVQSFLAMAQNEDTRLAKGFVQTLGRIDERYLHDDCSCHCSSKGCIPSSSLWRDRSWMDIRIYRMESQCLAHSIHSTRKWTRYWGYSRKEKEFIYREGSRNEIFQRLGMIHLCCFRADEMGGRRFVETGHDRAHIELEDKESAHNLKCILHFYVLLRKVCPRIPIESFWVHWWDNMDTILPPTVSIPAPQDAMEVPNYDERLAYRAYLEKARDYRWRASLERAGYKDWDYGDVIRHHCTKMLLKARAYKEKETAWKRHRLVTRPRFIRNRPSKSSNVQPEEEWSSSSDGTE